MSRYADLVSKAEASREQLASPYPVRGDNAWTVDDDACVHHFKRKVKESQFRIQKTSVETHLPASSDVALSAFEKEISASAFLLSLEDDDDPDFVPVTSELLDRVSSFVRRLALHTHAHGFQNVGPPSIRPASSGSIDLFWESVRGTLLINFSPVTPKLFHYFGQRGSNEMSGQFELAEGTTELICWLARL